MNRTNLFTFFLCALLVSGCDMAEEADSETDGQAPALADLHADGADQRAIKKSKARKNQASHPDGCFDNHGGEAQSLSSLLAQSQRDTTDDDAGRGFNHSFQSNPLIRAIEYLSADRTARVMMGVLADQDWTIVQNTDDMSKEDFSAYVWSHPDCPKQIIFTNRLDAVEEPVKGRSDIKIAMILAEEIHTAHSRESFDLKPGNLIDQLSHPPVKDPHKKGVADQSDPIPLTPMSERAVRHLIEGVTVSLAVMDMHAIFKPNRETGGQSEYKQRSPGAGDGLSEWDILKKIRPDILPVLEAVEIANEDGLEKVFVFAKALEAYTKTTQALTYDQHYLEQFFLSDGEERQAANAKNEQRAEEGKNPLPIIKEIHISDMLSIIYPENGRDGIPNYFFPHVQTTAQKIKPVSNHPSGLNLPITSANDNHAPRTVNNPVQHFISRYEENKEYIADTLPVGSSGENVWPDYLHYYTGWIGQKFIDNERLTDKPVSFRYHRLHFPQLAEIATIMVSRLDRFEEAELRRSHFYDASGNYFNSIGPPQKSSQTKLDDRQKIYNQFIKIEDAFIASKHDGETEIVFEKGLDGSSAPSLSGEYFQLVHQHRGLFEKTRRLIRSFNLMD